MAMKRKQPERFTLSSVFSDKQLDRLMQLRVEGYTYQEITELLNKQFGKKFKSHQVSHAFTTYKDEYVLPDIQTHPERQKKESREKLKALMTSYIKEKESLPNKTAFINYGASRDAIDKLYEGEIRVLIRELRKESPELFDKILDETSFTKEAFKKVNARIKNTKKILVVSAVNGTEVHDGFFKALRTWKQKTGGEVLVLPCADPAKSRQTLGDWTLDSRLKEFIVVFKDVWINNNIYLSSIKLSAKQIKPATGLKRFVHKRGSFIYANPKQFMEHVPTASAHSHRLLATPGALTVPDYNTRYYMSERTAWIANEDHCLGGIIIDILDKDLYFPRNFQAEPDTGNFRDLDTEYRADGKTKRVFASYIGLGDYHQGNHDEKAKQASKELIDLMQPEYASVEDFFTGYSINPHERRKHVKLARRAGRGELYLERELRSNAEEMDELAEWKVKQWLVKKGNHEMFLSRYLDDGVYRPHDRYISICLEKAMHEDEDPYEFALKEFIGLNNPDKFQFLGLNDEFFINGINCGPHGHLGANGKRNPSLAELENCYGACNVGHNHSGAVWRNVFRSGTLEKLRAGYNDGPSGWTHTNILQHTNGSRQLVTIIQGLWRGDD